MKAKKNGFSLIEIMAVVAIFGILCSLAGPSFIAALRHRALDQFMRQFVSTLHKAQNRAILKRRLISLTLDAGSYKIQTRQGDKIYERVPADPGATYSVDYTIDAEDLITFNWLGSLVDGNGNNLSNLRVNFTDRISGEIMSINIINSGAIEPIKPVP